MAVRSAEGRCQCGASTARRERQVRSKGIRISRLQLTDDAFLGVPIPIPPESEQAAIARYLKRPDRRVRRCIQSAQRQIEPLDEYRVRLITDVVTGKLDVHEAAVAQRAADPLATRLTTVPE